jgi:glycosyltransferase involved in cell wall biosynthesis
MHILFLTDNFFPEVNAPASRTFEHVREWVALGARVTVITCAPNFPHGKVFDGFQNRLWQCQMIDGVRVIRVWSFIAANEGFVLRIFDYISFMITATLASLFVLKVDVVIGTSPQFFTVCAAWVVGRLKRIPWVFELRDIWPESIKAVGAMRDSFTIRLLERLELFLYRQATCIVSVTQSFKSNLIQRGIDGKKVEVVTNGVDLAHFMPQQKDQELSSELGLRDRFVAGYIGTHGMAHGLEILLEAAQLIQSYPSGENISILLLGNGAKKAELIANAESRGLTNVLFLDSISKAEITRYWSLLDISIIHLRKTELFASVIPSKLFECMGMGIPVLHGVAGESAQIVLAEQIGEVFDSENANQLVELLLDLKTDSSRINRYQKNGIEAAKRYDRKHLAAKMLAILKRLVSK